MGNERNAPDLSEARPLWSRNAGEARNHVICTMPAILNKRSCLTSIAMALHLVSGAQPPVFRSAATTIQWRINGTTQAYPWEVTPSARPDVVEVICKNGPGSVTFLGDTDSLHVLVKPGEQKDFVVLVPGMDSAFTRVVGKAYVPPQPLHADVQRWLRTSAVTLGAPSAFTALDAALDSVRVVALGEATHGQHEAFELKRAWTMHLVRNKGFRYVAYETSASKARLCEDYIAGRSNDRRTAMRGFDMLIWEVEENVALLDDLRAWNQAAEPDDQVHFFGVDAQDGHAVEARMTVLLATYPDLSTRIQLMRPRAEAAVQAHFQGDRRMLDSVLVEVGQLRADIERATANDPQRANIVLHTQELCAYFTQYGSPGGRDRAMGELLLLRLAQLEPDARCVFWAHNAHVQKSALSYLGTDELASGGHLHKSLGDAFYSVGFTFGIGEFQATAQFPSGGHGFKRYTHKHIVEGSLESQLSSVNAGDHFIDLRHAPKDDAVQQWLTTGHGLRWWGGYMVPDDVDAATGDLTHLSQLHPITDHDGLVFLAKTTAARPMDAARILAP